MPRINNYNLDTNIYNHLHSGYMKILILKYKVEIRSILCLLAKIIHN